VHALGVSSNVTISSWETGARRIPLRLRPDFAQAHTNLGLLLWKENDLEGAQEEFRTALKLGSLDAHLSLGAILDEKGQFDEAIAEYKELIASDPIRPDCGQGK